MRYHEESALAGPRAAPRPEARAVSAAPSATSGSKPTAAFTTAAARSFSSAPASAWEIRA
jgi:hypothetical protein